MPKTRIFIIDDITQTLRVSSTIVSGALKELGTEADIETFGESSVAREHWLRKRPDLVFLDISMPDPDGMEMLRWWTQVRQLQDTRVVVVSYKQDQRSAVENLRATFWPKTGDYRDFLQRCRLLLQSMRAYRKPYSEHVFRLQLILGAPTRISVSGNIALDERSDESWSSRWMERQDEIDGLLQTNVWYQAMQSRGHDLYREIFVDHVAGAFQETRSNAELPENLRMRFSAQIENVTGGFEMLFDRPPRVGGDFLTLRHPMATQIDALNPTFNALGRDQLNEAKEHGRAIRFLLIAANLEDTLPALEADAEIGVLASEIPRHFRLKGIEAQITSVLSNEASFQKLHELSRTEQFDVLHFAGHATSHDPHQKEPGLYVWNTTGGKRTEYLITLPQMEGLIKRMMVSFAFLNCCRGGMQRDTFYLRHSRLLGIPHAILKAGARAVLCYRSSVIDASAASFAIDFYKHLADSGELDLGLHAARNDAYERNPNDSIWLSAMLFDQTS